KSVVPISDAVGAIRAVAAHRHVCSGEIINVAGAALTIHEIVCALASGRANPPRILSIPRALIRPALAAAPAIVRALAALGRSYISDAVLDGSKLGRLTGFSSAANVRQELARLGSLT